MYTISFETSKGIVKCTVDTSKPEISEDPKFPNYVHSEGKIIIIDGKSCLDELYTWADLSIKNGWVRVELDDGFYGSPEYRSWINFE